MAEYVLETRNLFPFDYFRYGHPDFRGVFGNQSDNLGIKAFNRCSVLYSADMVDPAEGLLVLDGNVPRVCLLKEVVKVGYIDFGC